MVNCPLEMTHQFTHLWPVPVYPHHCKHWLVMIINTCRAMSILKEMKLCLSSFIYFCIWGIFFLLQLLTTRAVILERCWTWGNSVSFLFVLSLEVNPNYCSGWAAENFCSIWNILCSRKFSHSFVANLRAWLQLLQQYLRPWSLSPGD